MKGANCLVFQKFRGYWILYSSICEHAKLVAFVCFCFLATNNMDKVCHYKQRRFGEKKLAICEPRAFRKISTTASRLDFLTRKLVEVVNITLWAELLEAWLALTIG